MTIEAIQQLRSMVVDLVRADGNDRKFTFRGVTETLARDGGILRIDGMDTKAFDENPVVLWEHNFSSGVNVIGKVVDTRIDKKAKAVDFDVEFVPEGTSELADTVRDMVDAGFVRAASVGFRIKAFEQLGEEQRAEMGGPHWVANEWELNELSLVPVGADPAALKRMIPHEPVAPELVAVASTTDNDQLVAAMRELRETIVDLRTAIIESEESSEAVAQAIETGRASNERDLAQIEERLAQIRNDMTGGNRK